MGKRPEQKPQQTPHKEDTQMAKKHMKMYSTSYVISQPWDTMTPPLEWLKCKTLTAPDAGEDMEQREL